MASLVLLAAVLKYGNVWHFVVGHDTCQDFLKRWKTIVCENGYRSHVEKNILYLD
jgi:hypothetical protein